MRDRTQRVRLLGGGCEGSPQSQKFTPHCCGALLAGARTAYSQRVQSMNSTDLKMGGKHTRGPTRHYATGTWLSTVGGREGTDDRTGHWRSCGRRVTTGTFLLQSLRFP